VLSGRVLTGSSLDWELPENDEGISTTCVNIDTGDRIGVKGGITNLGGENLLKNELSLLYLMEFL